MRYKLGQRIALRRLSNSIRRARRDLLLESLEHRVVLSGTPTLVDLNPTGVSEPSDFTRVGAATFFVADDGATGRELWITDGTAAGTSQVSDIRAGANSSSPRELIELDGQLFFVADDGANGQELWKSDGSEVGTVLVRDINPGEGYQYPYGDGPLQSLPRGAVPLDGQLFFSAEESGAGSELWASDGSSAGTVLVSDIFSGTYTNDSGTYPNSSGVQELVNVNGNLFFTADDGINGRELWTSDGTAAGTTLVKDIFTGTYPDGAVQKPNSSNPQKLTSASGLLFFVAKDADGLEIWRSDGTDAGTFQIQDINPGAADAFGDSSELAALGDGLLFTANDGTNGDELWRTDGTTAGTALLKDINPGAGGNLSYYTGFTELDGALFFSADDGMNGRELWRSDGTEAGTALVKDIHPGMDSSGSPYVSYPFYMANVDGTLYFSALTDEDGRELWQSDGTEAGTVLVADTVDGSVGLYPTNLEQAGDTLVFSGDDGTGRELFVLVPEGEATTNSARVSIFIDSQPVTIPLNLGVNADGSRAVTYTQGALGDIKSNIGSGATLGDLFDTWRTAAGLAGNNLTAILSDTQLLDRVENATNTVQMFVNGQLSEAFDEYVMQNGDEIVLIYGDNPVVSLNTNFGSIVVELFEEATPGTVDNFLNYVNDGDYINSIFHRSADSMGTDFVIQGGGFSSATTSFTSTVQFTSVPTDPSIQNEPGISNLRGTIAMAKGSDPNSATSQFFVNLADTNAFLDDPNNSGGFTAFGQVLDLTTSDTIAALPVDTTNDSPFSELPLSTNNELVVIQEIIGQGDLTGVKFSDDNGNGVRDGSSEAALVGVAVYVDANNNGQRDSGETSTTTDADGRYLLQVQPGTHTIRAEVSTGKVTTVPVAPESYTVTVEIGRDINDLDFGEADPPSPTGLDLLSGTDSGIADDDDLTRFNNITDFLLQFEVTGVTPGADVRILSDGTLIGTATAVSDTVIVFSDGATVLADGTYDFTATQTINDGTSAASPQLTVTIDTTAPAPLASTAPDIAQAGQLYTFDADSPDEGQTGIVYGLTNPPSGMTIDSATGLISWTPMAAQAIPHTTSIVVVDAAGNSSSQVVDFTVLGVIPAFPDDYFVAEDSTLTVDVANGVLANDGDDSTGGLMASAVTQPTNGTLSFSSDGSFTYVPNADFFGEDSFTYIASDGTNDTNVAKATIQVTAVNDAAVPQEDSYTATEDTVLTIDAATGLLANDTDIDGDTLTTFLTIDSQPSNGTVVVAADGSFVYTPAAEFSGDDSFRYTVNDGTATSGPSAVNITVTEVADPPTAAADAYDVNEDETLSVDVGLGVLSNDVDPDSTTITAILGTQPANGSVTLNSGGSFTYTPDADFFGVDSFTYTASDGANASAAATVTITVSAQQDAPSANDDTFTVDGNSAATTIDVLSNDSSTPDVSQPLSIVAVTQGSAGGAVTISGSSVSYTPPTNFTGNETFTYTIEDTDGLTDTATVTVAVTEAANNNISGFVYLDLDRDGVRDPGESGIPGVQITLAGTDLAGSAISRVALTTDAGAYTFDELPSGTFRVTERQPIAASDGSDATSDSNATAGNDVISNITLSGGQTIPENNFGEASILPQYTNIVWFFASSLNSEGLFRETIAIAEEMAGNDSLAASIRAGTSDVPADVNSSPTATNDSFSLGENGTLATLAIDGVLTNDADPDGDSLIALLVSSTSDGTLSFSADGSFVYTPNTGFSGSDSFTYQASDGVGLSTIATVALTVSPDAGTNTFSVAENTATGEVVGSLTPEGELGSTVVFEIADPNLNDALRLVADDHITGNPAGSVVLIEYVDFQCPVCRTFHPIVEQLEQDFADDLVVITRHFPLQSIHFNAFAAAVATEAAGRQGAFDAYGDLLFENQDEWASATDPQALFESYATQQGLNFTQFLADQAAPALTDRVQRDLDAIGELGGSGTPTFFLNGEQIPNPASAADFTAVVQAEVDDTDDAFQVDRQTGEVLVRNSAALDFEATQSFSQPVNATGSNGGFRMITATINLTNVNDVAPVASADGYTVSENGSLDVVAAAGVLANDTDVDGDSLTSQLGTGPTDGSLLLDADGSFTYVPNTNFDGTDSFTYTASDGVFSSAATVTISVTASNSQPIVAADTYTVNEDSTLTVDVANGLLANDQDPEGATLTSSLESSPTNGTLALNSDGSFTYSPNAEFSGTDDFAYSVSDGELSAAADVTITVTAIPDAPVALADTYEGSVDTALSVDASNGVLANDTDGDGDTLTATVVDQSVNGDTQLNSDGSFTYVPDAGFVGTDSFTYRASDGVANSGNVTVIINVGAPVIAGVRLEAASSDGTPITSVIEGESFVLNVYAMDLRSVPQGVFASYFDLFYESTVVSPDGEITFSDAFSNGQSGNASAGGVIDELGAFASVITPTGEAESLLVSVSFTADASGLASFATDPADILPLHEAGIFGQNGPVPFTQFSYGTFDLDVLPAGEGEAGSQAEFAAQADELFATQQDWLTS